MPSATELGENVTVTYGKQNRTIDLTKDGAVKANDWLYLYEELNDNTCGYLDANSVSSDDLTVTWTGHSFESEEVAKGYNEKPRLSYRFWENGKYVTKGVYEGTVAIKNGPSYNIKATVETAAMPLTILDSEGGELKATYTNGTAISGDVEEGKNIVLNPAPKDGYIFDKFEVKGLDVVDAEKHIYKVNIERDSKGIDVLSAKALFKKGTYTVTVEATGTENGNFKIINLSKSNEEFASTRNVSFGDKFKVEVTPAPGYRAVVKIDNQTQALNDNTCTFEMNDVDKTNITVTVSFEENATAQLMIVHVDGGITIKVDGEEVHWNSDGSSNNYEKSDYAIGQTVNITFKTFASPEGSDVPNIQDVLVNAGNTECKKDVAKDGTVSISFKMPQEGAIVEVKLITGKEITVKSKTGQNEQVYTYDNKEHAFEYITDPAGLTCVVEYSTDGENYYSELPKKVGTYKVRITRDADKNGLYNAIEKTDYTNFTVKIEAAETVINSYPTVTINKDTKKYTISGGSANVTGKWEIVDENDEVLTEAPAAESALVTVRFTPTDVNLYEVATAQVEARCDGKALDKVKISYTVPENSGIEMVVKNGNKVLKSGDEVISGTTVTYILTIPKGLGNVVLYEKDLNTQYGADDEYEWNATTLEKTLKVKVSRTLNLEVRYEGTASVTKLNPTFKDESTPISIEYTGEIGQLYEVTDFSYNSISSDVPTGGTSDYVNLSKLIQISYIDEKGNKLSAPINAGVYKVNITIPEYVGNETTYEAFDGIVGNVVYTITKATPRVSAWPEMAVVGVGKTLKYAKFGGASANVEGSFEFTQPDKTPTNGESYPIQFVPKDEANYKVVAEGKEAKAVVTDQRILSISSYSNGTVTVTDQNGNELKDGAILGSNITSIKVTATPSTGYVLSSLRVNNSTISSGASYTLTGSEEIVAVSVTFARQYTITLGTAPRGVKIASKPTSNVVTAGGTYTFTLNHLSGDKPTVTGASNISVSTSGGTSTVKVTNIQANATLAISISATPIEVTLEKTLSKAGKEMGTLRASGLNSSNECYYGDKVTITATANAGVEFSGWEGLTSTANPYEFEATQASYTFKAEYDGILTGIESVDEIRYYGADGYIYVNAPAPGTLTIISMNGRSQRLQVSGQTRVTVAAGIYGIVLDMDGEVIRDKVVVR